MSTTLFVNCQTLPSVIDFFLEVVYFLDVNIRFLFMQYFGHFMLIQVFFLILLLPLFMANLPLFNILAFHTNS